ncbi:MAG TPA: HD domain-containing protein [Candidatus Paceibacterota bacterium]
MLATIQEAVVSNELIRRAYEFAKKSHFGERRRNGEPFFNHCLATAEALIKWHLDAETIAAGFLHDVPESSKSDSWYVAEIRKNFGEAVASIVAGVINIGKIRYHGVETKADNLRKFIIYLSEDLRVIFVKLATRLNTLKSLYAYPEEIKKNMALKVMEIYAPIASQLGMYHTAGELEDLAFPYLYPKDYASLMESVLERYEEREKYLERFKPLLRRELELNGVKVAEIFSRSKHYYSLYKKLLRYDMDLDKIYDLVALRVIVSDISDCYTALGVIHKAWPPLPGRIKDYIAVPKLNNYRSLHTTVYTPEGKTAEIQIRTPAMHEEAELGIAAHFNYSSFKGVKQYLGRLPSKANLEELNLTRELRQFPKKLSDVSFFKDRILVLTPKGDVIDLPQGSTPLDFAYKIHTDVGNSCAGAKINGKIESLDYELQAGNIVEILIQKNKNPSPDWLNIVKTRDAKEKIKSALNSDAKKNIGAKPNLLRSEFLIAAENNPGLLKSISEAFLKERVGIKIFSVKANNSHNSTSVKIHAERIDENKFEKIFGKLRAIAGVKKIQHRLV